MNSIFIVALMSCVLLLVVGSYPVFFILRRNWRMEREEVERKRLADLAQRQAQRQARREARRAPEPPPPPPRPRAQPKKPKKKASPKKPRTPKTRRTRFDHIDDD